MTLLHRYPQADSTIDTERGDVESRVLDLLKSPPVCISPELSIGFAQQIVLERGLQSLVVIDTKGQLLGLLSREDILGATVPRVANKGDARRLALVEGELSLDN